MGLKICSLSSGSSGNCIYVASDTTRILIDAGITTDRIERSLRVLGGGFDNLSVLVTHAHSDHVSNLASFGKSAGAKVYAHYLSAPAVMRRGKLDVTEFGGGEFTVGDICVSPFAVPHDVPCVGFTLRLCNKAVSVLTDLGEAEAGTVRAISDSDIVLIESNHDEGLVKSGAYPWPLKKRILSREGHLSNAACAEVCTSLAANGRVKQIILGHLSRENNYPELAFSTVKERMLEGGIIEGRDVALSVAGQHKRTALFKV
jgi:phosphoribosyl 1,2-cyclic phosphodiesterase